MSCEIFTMKNYMRAVFNAVSVLMTKRPWLVRQFVYNTVAYLLQARNVQTESQPSSGNGCVTRNNGVTVRSGGFYADHVEAI
jgi:hypothetical protein